LRSWKRKREILTRVLPVVNTLNVEELPKCGEVPPVSLPIRRRKPARTLAELKSKNNV
jgi:hypothetical protein